jgi:hypothetical protein
LHIYIGNHHPCGDVVRDHGHEVTVYLVAKSEGNGNLHDDERGKVLYGKAHFSTLNVPFGVAITLSNVLAIIG